MFSTWWRKLAKAKVQATQRGRRKSARGQMYRRLQLEMLECRLVPATHTWSGGGATTHWSESANWSAGGAPVNNETGAVLNFPAGASRLGGTNDVVNLGVQSMTFGTFYVITGNAITLSGSITATNPDSTVITVQLPIALGGNVILNVSNPNAELSLQGVISGAFSLTATSGSNGSVELEGANTYTGGTTTAGNVLLYISTSTALGSGPVTVSGDGGSLVLFNWSPWTIPNAINGGGFSALRSIKDSTLTGAVNISPGYLSVCADDGMRVTLAGVVSGPGQLLQCGGSSNTPTLVLNRGNTYTGGTDIRSGTLKLGVANAVPSAGAVMVESGATLNVNNLNDTIGSLSGGGTVTLGSATLTTGNDNTSTTFSGTISGSGGLNKIGSGTLTLSSPSPSYSGTVTVGSGGLAIGANNALGSGPLVLNGGTLQSSASVTLSNSFTVNTPSTIAGSHDLTFNSAGTLSGTNALTVNNSAGTVTFNGVLSGSSGIAKTSTGNLTLSVANTYGGSTNLQGGILTVGSNTSLSTGVLTLGGGTLQSSTGASLANPFTVSGSANIGGSNNLTLNGAGTLTGGNMLTINNTAGTISLSGGLSGSGSLTKANTGTLSLPVADTYSGGTTLTAGTLTVGSGTSLGTGALTLQGGLLQSSTPLTLSNPFTVAGPAAIGGTNDLTLSGTGTLSATLTVSNTAGTISLAGLLAGSGGLTRNNAGTLVLSHASNSYAGLTTVNGGTLQEATSFAIQNGNNLIVAAGATFDHETTNHQLVDVYLDRLQGDGLISGIGTVAIGFLGGDSSFSGRIIGSSDLVKYGAGQFTLTGNTNDYSGGTSVFNGSLLLGNSGALPGNTDLYVNTSATFNLNSFSATTRSLAGSGTVMLGSGRLTTGTLTTTFGGRLTGGNGQLLKQGPGTLTLTNDHITTNDYTGGTTVMAGTLRIGGDNRLPSAGAVTVTPNATLDFHAGTTNFLAASRVTVMGIVSVSGGTVNFSSGTGIVLPTLSLSAGQLMGSDTVTITSQMTWTGGTMAGTGMTMIGGGGQMLINDSTTKHGQGRPICNAGTTIWNGSGGLWLGGGSYFDNEPGATFMAQSDAALIAIDATTPTFFNEGIFVKAAGSSMAATTIGGGQYLLDFRNGGTLEVDTGTVFLAGNALHNFMGGTLTGGTYIVVGTLQFTGASNFVTNAATLVLDGSGPGQILDENLNNGLANLADIAAGGTLTLQNGYMLTTGGDLMNFGYLLVDATSQLNVSGNYMQDAAATLEIQLGGAGGPSGQLNVAGTATLNGTLTLTPVNGYVPSTGDSFAILTYGARSGDFANPPVGFTESFDDGNGILTVVAQ